VEVKHHAAGKATHPSKIKGPYKRNEHMIKDDLLLEKLRHYTQTGGTEDIFQFPRSQDQQNLFKTFQEGNFLFVECSQVLLFHFSNL